jgi:hypothetical protein
MTTLIDGYEESVPGMIEAIQKTSIWDAIEEEGRKAFDAGIELWDNPYEPYSEECIKWSRGWNGAFNWLRGQS